MNFPIPIAVGWLRVVLYLVPGKRDVIRERHVGMRFLVPFASNGHTSFLAGSAVGAAGAAAAAASAFATASVLAAPPLAVAVLCYLSEAREVFLWSIDNVDIGPVYACYTTTATARLLHRPTPKGLRSSHSQRQPPDWWVRAGIKYLVLPTSVPCELLSKAVAKLREALEYPEIHELLCLEFIDKREACLERERLKI